MGVTIFGIDFTSSPSRRKPITVARCRLRDHTLDIDSIDPLDTLPAFGALLSSDGLWVAGIDFPFGQPRKYVENIGWPLAWYKYVHHVESMGKAAFIAEIRAYQRDRAQGDIRHFRTVDRLAGACSPMQLDFVPVARMFFAGAPTVLNAGCSVYPFFSTDHNSRVVVEAYPSMAARLVVGSKSYKTDDKKKQTQEQRSARQAIVGALSDSQRPSSVIGKTYGTAVQFNVELAKKTIEDGTGDTLDSVLCALQAAWAASRRNNDFGMNWSCDPIEGWIADPALLAKRTSTSAE